MSKIIENLKKEEKVIVFDFDGVLGSYEYTDMNHAIDMPDEEWDEYVEKFNPLEDSSKIRPFKTLQKFLKEKDMSRVYVCSVAGGKAEESAKMKFAMNHYNIPKENIFFVPDKTKKLDFLKYLHEEKYPELKESDIAMVEDTVKTLNQIFNNSDFMTVHVTSFMD